MRADGAAHSTSTHPTHATKHFCDEESRVTFAQAEINDVAKCAVDESLHPTRTEWEENIIKRFNRESVDYVSHDIHTCLKS